ncbi:trypsin-like peptidase domain-containing protein [Taibaiella lutea]|uniref:Trypsin-like peptidase domain-containing protein n=1 Tax=Taibaiella lutea TaxID=2608001 RepID=A0A5M6CIA0_9BACT|nr:serine protease [Taibaiella lutea]KAA5534928.1 trypsin-like peptidase domain-containing protein [Taibaiella lutea]
MKASLKPGQVLSSTTVRIEANSKSITKAGTGFFYSIGDKDKSEYVSVIITNYHVLEGAENIYLVFTLSDKLGNSTGNFTKYKVNDIQTAIVRHPDPAVDLCAISLYPIVEDMRTKYSQEIYTHYITKSIIPSSLVLQQMDSIEEIIMIGYPNGLWDEQNNLPICRKGITATSPQIDYNGKQEFLIDAACFPGSSGSPVFYSMKADGNMIGEIILLGILSKGPKMTFKNLSVPINLGLVIKASRLIELEAEIIKMVEFDAQKFT